MLFSLKQTKKTNTMKTKSILVMAALLAIATTSCMQNPEGEKVKSGEATEISFPKDASILNPNLELSQIEWLGTKPTGTHYGTLSIKDGKLYLKDGKLLGGVYAIILIPIVFIMVRKIPVHLSKQYHFVGLAIILTAFTSMMIVENIKPIVGRVRFRSMQENPSLFTNWYQINGSKFLSSVPLKEEIKSFPSGHSQWAGTTLTLSLIALANPKWRNKEKLIFSGSLIYALTVMLSRMMQGAHFLSDVTVGFGTAFVCYLIFRKILVENKIEE